MKKIIAFVLSAVIIMGILPTILANAEGNSPESEILYYDDGSYAVITITYGLASNAEVNASKSIKSGSKTVSYYDDSGALKWKATLTASFTYDGSTSSCTSANSTVAICDSDWYVISNNSGHAGNTATANVTMGRRYLGVTVKTVPVTITLSCDANGNLS